MRKDKIIKAIKSKVQDIKKYAIKIQNNHWISDLMRKVVIILQIINIYILK